MRIERKYYDLMIQESENLEAEIQYEKSLLSDEELKKQTEQRMLEAQHIIDLANAKMQKTKHIQNKKKMDQFHSLYKIALTFAENNHMNILIETDTTTGRIKIHAPFVHFGVLTPNTDKDMLLALIECADSVRKRSSQDGF